MDSVTIFDAVPFKEVAISMLQSATLFIFSLVGLELIGRRVFGEKSPQDLVMLILISEACSGGLFLQEAGYWGAVASALTLLILAYSCDRIPFIRNLIESQPVILYKNNRLYLKNMQEYLITKEDLQETAREYGLSSYENCFEIILEADGNITAILQKKTNFRQAKK